MKQICLKQFEACISIYDSKDVAKRYYRIRFPKWFCAQFKNWGYVINGDDSIRFSKESNYRHHINGDYSIWCKMFIIAMLKNHGFSIKPQHIICSFSYSQCGGVMDVKFDLPQMSMPYIPGIKDVFPTPILFTEPDEPEFESQEDVLERVKKDVTYLKSMGVKCSFSYETTKVVTETI